MRLWSVIGRNTGAKVKYKLCLCVCKCVCYCMCVSVRMVQVCGGLLGTYRVYMMTPQAHLRERERYEIESEFLSYKSSC